MLCARPGGEVVTTLGDQPEREVRAEAIDLGEILAKQFKKRRADIEVRPVRFPGVGADVAMATDRRHDHD